VHDSAPFSGSIRSISLDLLATDRPSRSSVNGRLKSESSNGHAIPKVTRRRFLLVIRSNCSCLNRAPYPRCDRMIGPIPWGHSGPLCHALSLLSMLLWTSMRRRRATVATPGEWQCKTGGVRRLAVANGPNIFQMLLVTYIWSSITVKYGKTDRQNR